MLEYVDLLMDAWDRVNDNGQMMALFEVALIFLILRRKEQKPFLYVFSLILFVLVFNPLSVMLFVPEIVGEKQYYLLFQSLPVMMLVGYAFVCAVRDREKRSEKWIVAIALTLICVMACGTSFSRTRFDKVENQYRIPTEAVEIFDAVTEQAENVTMIAPNELMEYASAYTSKIQFYYDLELMQSDENSKVYEPAVVDLYEAVQYGENGLGKVTSRAKEFGCTYLIFEKVEANPDELYAGLGAYVFHESWAMEAGGYELVLDTEHYVVYRDTTL